MTALTFHDLEALTSGRLGKSDVACPDCGPGRRQAHNRKRPVLTVWRTGDDFASYNCARCGLHGYARRAGTIRKKRAAPANDTAPDDHAKRQGEKARWLWQRREAAPGTVVETYLREVRGYRGPIPATIGYLPPKRPEQHPAMIAAFGIAEEPEPGIIAIKNTAIRGVHLTLLTPDGRGKADTEKQKLMVGPSSGWPIILAPPNDLLGLAICEGIESSLSIYESTGLGVWAAGSAGRMPALADKFPRWIDCVTVAGEADEAGQKGADALIEALQGNFYVELANVGGGDGT